MTVPADWEVEFQLASSACSEVSQDRTRFIIVVKRGDVATNTNVFSMLLWDTADIRRATSRLVS